MTLLSLLRRCLPAFGRKLPPSRLEQIEKAWGGIPQGYRRTYEADPAKVQIKPRRAALRRAS